MAISRDFYFEAIKIVLDRSIDHYCGLAGKSQAEVDAEIIEHIKQTSPQYRNPDPDINYVDPLCRLGYLFTHAGANACLFEKTIQGSRELQGLLEANAKGSLNVCTVGGGPGTELLGLTRYLLRNEINYREISFTVLDSINEWGETWNYIYQESIRAFSEHGGSQPTINRSFYQMDVLDPSSYRPYAWLFEQTDLMVFNYLLSENKIRLPIFLSALNEMVLRAPKGCFFVIIDRLERNTPFLSDVIGIINDSGLKIINKLEFSGVMDDQESGLGDYPVRFGKRPRRWFRTITGHYPTVFALIAQKI